MTPAPDASTADRLQTALWIAAGLGILALLYALAPILTPFPAGRHPRLHLQSRHRPPDRLGLPRMLAVVLVIVALVALGAGLVLIILPLLYEEAMLLAARLPEALALVNEKLAPWLRQNFGMRLKLDAASLQKLAAGNWDTVQVILERIYSSLKIGGVALVGLVVNLLLAPVVLFYLLLDWHGMIGRLGGIVPRPWHAKIGDLARDIDGCSRSTCAARSWSWPSSPPTTPWRCGSPTFLRHCRSASSPGC
jgi:predicted PurR-regulated permease PerM